MNTLWRATLRNRALASVRIHRKPASRPLGVGGLVNSTPSIPPHRALAGAPRGDSLQDVKPYIHIIFKRECAEPWMIGVESDIPKIPNWLANRGFDNMEYFDIKVGVESAGAN